MVNQTIEQLLQEAIDQSMAQTQESRELAEEVSGKMADIDQKVVEAEQRTDQAIADVNAAIPNAVRNETFKVVFADPNGDDVLGDGTAANPFQTITRAIAYHGTGINLEVRLTAEAVYNESVNLPNVHRRWVILSCHSTEGATINLSTPGAWISAGILFLATYRVNMNLLEGARLCGFKNNTGSLNSEQTLILGGTYTWDGELTSGGGHLTLTLSGTFQSTDPANIMPQLGRYYSTVRFCKSYATTHWPAGKTWRDFLNIGGTGYNDVLTDVDIDA
ncbi:hypothetical protein AB4371_10425 [Vibrio sp. 10N.261.51.A3]|uniref:hypothetical protein n=1 Tax=Vibrio sp. 10N.261.51.A3 TaxID=3229673 RepID=UPI00354FA833